jgi:carbon monoxide dehydrogenase subunit G
VANGKYTIDLPVSIQNIWTYISDIDQWASSIPGYVSHEISNEKQSTWAIKGDLGLMKKTAKLQVDITEWLEPTKVSFTFKSLAEDFVGKGYYEAEVLDDQLTRITGYLEIDPEAKGAMGSMQKSILKKFVPRTAKEMATAVAGQIMQQQ